MMRFNRDALGKNGKEIKWFWTVYELIFFLVSLVMAMQFARSVLGAMLSHIHARLRNRESENIIIFSISSHPLSMWMGLWYLFFSLVYCFWCDILYEYEWSFSHARIVHKLWKVNWFVCWPFGKYSDWLKMRQWQLWQLNKNPTNWPRKKYECLQKMDEMCTFAPFILFDWIIFFFHFIFRSLPFFPFG